MSDLDTPHVRVRQLSDLGTHTSDLDIPVRGKGCAGVRNVSGVGTPQRVRVRQLSDSGTPPSDLDTPVRGKGVYESDVCPTRAHLRGAKVWTSQTHV